MVNVSTKKKPIKIKRFIVVLYVRKTVHANENPGLNVGAFGPETVGVLRPGWACP